MFIFFYRLFTSRAKFTGAGTGAFFKYAGEIELILKAHVAPHGGDGHPGGAEQQLRLADALILAPAQYADAKLLAEQVRQTRRRQADVLGNAGDIKLAIGQVVAMPNCWR